eukprot:PhF_6_TR3327/c0_g1_i2/m.4698
MAANLQNILWDLATPLLLFLGGYITSYSTNSLTLNVLYLGFPVTAGYIILRLASYFNQTILYDEVDQVLIILVATIFFFMIGTNGLKTMCVGIFGAAMMTVGFVNAFLKGGVYAGYFPSTFTLNNIVETALKTPSSKEAGAIAAIAMMWCALFYSSWRSQSEFWEGWVEDTCGSVANKMSVEEYEKESRLFTQKELYKLRQEALKDPKISAKLQSNERFQKFLSNPNYYGLE